MSDSGQQIAKPVASSELQKKRPVERLKLFLYGASKLGIALGIALVILCTVGGAIYFGFVEFQKRQKMEAERPWMEAKEWPSMAFVGGAQANLVTKYSDEAILYRLQISNLPAEGLSFKSYSGIFLRLVDSDGFTVVKRFLNSKDKTRIWEEMVQGYVWEGTITLPMSQYMRVKQSGVSWSGVSVANKPLKGTFERRSADEQAKTKLSPPPTPGTFERRSADEQAKPKLSPPPPPATAGWRVKQNWRRIREGMNQAQVRSILGEPTYIESSGALYWVYGGRDTYSDPHVTFISGKVFGWKEP